MTHQQWRKNPGLEEQVIFVKSILAADSPDRERNLETFASLLGTVKAQLEAITHQPHGVRRLMTGRFTFPLKEEASYKQYVALQIGMLVSDHLVRKGGKFEDVYRAFERWLKEYRDRREDKEDDIEEENKRIAFVRAILTASVEKEETLEGGRDVAIKRAEKKYWQMIGELTEGGLTVD